MAITSIKEGKKENYRFKTTCPICGCEFEYELCDLLKEYDYSVCLTSYPPQYRYRRYVECPCCREKVIHDSGCDFGKNNHGLFYTTTTNTTELTLSEEEQRNKMFYVDYQNPGVVWNGGSNGELDCDKCPNKPNFNGKLVAGDTPCTWCPKNQPYCK